ncbi:MAG: glycosyltransferase family 2 protein [Chitinophagaceae bacterium]|nr:glycosyltransferase family 2 protein [Chitinophagaceae bacterium]
MQISVVIPTCNRKARLLSLLHCLDRSSYPLYEVIIVDSGDDRLLPSEYSLFRNLSIHYLSAERSVCIQRNKGVRAAESPWIFLCDDDIEIGNDYLQSLVDHLQVFSETGAVSGSWMEKVKGIWSATYPVTSAGALLWKYIFGLGIWGPIHCRNSNFVIKRLWKYYTKKGNHISGAGWPVNTDLMGEYAECPVYSLGASLVKKEWLTGSPFEEVLDRHGIGDNYGVITGFPVPVVQVVRKAVVYHHKEDGNRLQSPLQYYRRVLALDHFRRIRPSLSHVKKYRLVWSLTGNFLAFSLSGNLVMCKATLRLMWKITVNNNPYTRAAREGRKVEEPLL